MFIILIQVLFITTKIPKCFSHIWFRKVYLQLLIKTTSNRILHSISWGNIAQYINLVSMGSTLICYNITVCLRAYQYSKYVTFTPAPKECSAEQATCLFFKHVIKYWGLPRSIISDRGTYFTGFRWNCSSSWVPSSPFHWLPSRERWTNQEGQCSLGAIREALRECQPTRLR